MQLFYRIISSEQQKNLEIKRQIDFAHHVPGVARFRVNIFFQREALGGRLPPDPRADQDPRGARAAAEPALAHRQAARARARDRADRLGQVDDARGAGRRDQPHPPRAHPHDRGPGRVRAQAQELHRQPARGRRRRRELRRGPARSPARGPRRDPARRDARSRDDRHRADRRRDRPPRVRHPAHAERLVDGGPPDRRLPGRAAGADPDPDRKLAAGNPHPVAPPDRRRPGQVRGARDPLSGRRGPQPDPPGQGRAGLLDHADRHPAGHADDGAVARRARPAQDRHLRGRAVALQPSRTSCSACSSATATSFPRTSTRPRSLPSAPSGSRGASRGRLEEGHLVRGQVQARERPRARARRRARPRLLRRRPRSGRRRSRSAGSPSRRATPSPSPRRARPRLLRRRPRSGRRRSRSAASPRRWTRPRPLLRRRRFRSGRRSSRSGASPRRTPTSRRPSTSRCR